MSKKKKILLWILGLLVVAFISFQIVIGRIEQNLSGLEALPLADIDLEQAQDGVYIGSYAAFPVEAEVEVEIENHKIVSVTLLEHRHGQGANAEILTEVVVQAQSLDVDQVAGATYSSKVILKAIEDALLKASN
ncbi:FMN-binding protein [Acidaminobacter hydrogenoformans]|uniref:FMN-binding domain-containing protein n=1 Tax=Acidaminobacter hydrogenoformans DSM 2784 TaxID=1120920 RepID=A0A1G5S323_9FIRM|nr:FMN-binding protein [Acidaminobacter hydrogenoformans]SCZ80151.1 FMN-binding domain-containing protein [Acidaminobacter hydrogenoformans DSM 2784]